MQLNQLARTHGNEKAKRVGRGGKRGKTSGRGTKGQKARAGHRMRPELRDIIKKVPKNRGYAFTSHQVKPIPVNLAALETAFAAGESVNPETLLAKALVEKRGGKIPAIKILAMGTLTKSLTVSGVTLSGSAKEKITAAGGSVA